MENIVIDSEFVLSHAIIFDQEHSSWFVLIFSSSIQFNSCFIELSCVAIELHQSKHDL